MLIYDVLHKEAIYHSVISDLRNYGVKYRFKKSMFKTERLEGTKQISKKVFKTALSYQPLDVVNLSSGGIVHVPVFVSQASAFLEKYVTQEGLFRKAGSQIRQKELIIRLDNGGTLGEKHHAIDVANCLKSFFRDLPEPLIPYTYHDLFIHCAMLKTFRVQALLLACILLPPHHLNTLAFFMEFLKKVSLFEEQNKMNIDNLAKVIGLNIMPLQEVTMSAMQTRLELHLVIVKTLIENAENIGVLPDHITQAVFMETIDSIDNESNILDNHSHSKLWKKKHRSGSLTRKPHLSASNLNLRVFNGLKKIVGKNNVSEDGNIFDNQKIPENFNSLHTSNGKGTKKRKVEHLDPPISKKKRNSDKSDRAKKVRLSLERFVPRKAKINDENSESGTNTVDIHTERRWSFVNDERDLQRIYRTYSDSSSQLKLILKDNETSNEFHKEYNNVFIDGNINLSDDNDEQVLLKKQKNIHATKSHPQLNLSSEEIKVVNTFDQVYLYPPKINNFETYSHVEITSVNNDSEEYVTIPKSEYEEIKNRVSVIESRLSQEFGCVRDEEKDTLLPHSVKKVQTVYEKTLEEASIESTVTTDYLARKLGKELKIRRSGEDKVIRSPSARKIGNLRRRSQDKMMRKCTKRTSSWHISHESNLQTNKQTNQELNNVHPCNEKYLSTNYIKDDTYLRPVSTSLWEEDKNGMLNNVCEKLSNSNTYATKHNLDYIGTKVLPIHNRTHTTVRRVSSFHGNEITNTIRYSAENVEKLKKTNSQQNINLNNTAVTNLTPKFSCWKQGNMSWKDAEGYFTSNNQTNSPVTQTGRASIAKLRTQNAGMVLAKAKLFDDCTTKINAQNTILNKKSDFLNTKIGHCTSNSKQSSENVVLNRKSSKDIKDKNVREMECITSNSNQEDIKTCYYISQNSTSKIPTTPKITRNKHFNTVCTATNHKKENMISKTSRSLNKGSPNILQESRLSMYKSDNNTLCKTPHIKKPLSVKTPKSAKVLTKKSISDSHRTPLKAVTQLGTPKYQSPKSILKAKDDSRYP